MAPRSVTETCRLGCRFACFGCRRRSFWFRRLLCSMFANTLQACVAACDVPSGLDLALRDPGYEPRHAIRERNPATLSAVCSEVEKISACNKQAKFGGWLLKHWKFRPKVQTCQRPHYGAEEAASSMLKDFDSADSAVPVCSGASACCNQRRA